MYHPVCGSGVFLVAYSQEGRKERSYFAQYHRITQELLDKIKARGASGRPI